MLVETTCTVCYNVSPSYQTMDDIGVDVDLADSVDDALQLFFAMKKLDAHQKNTKNYFCGRCKVKVEAAQKWFILEAPKVVCVHLKRFDAFGNKIAKPVSFPSNLNINPYFKNKQNSVNYNLCSITSHLGKTSGSGHYTAICKSIGGSQYFLFNDSVVSSISTEKVREEKNAFILFYEFVVNPQQTPITSTDFTPLPKVPNPIFPPLPKVTIASTPVNVTLPESAPTTSKNST
jgi:ubiquitin carboxyl-terminal hydrolase 36/42